MEDMKNEANGSVEAGKTFTQDEVNQIVKNRLKEERGKMQKEQDAALLEREQAITAREMRMTAREKLNEKGLPADLVDAINCSDEDTINKSIEILSKNYISPENGSRLVGCTPRVNYSPRNGNTPTFDDACRRAMGL